MLCTGEALSRLAATVAEARENLECLPQARVDPSFLPSAMYMYFCCASRENATSQIDAVAARALGDLNLLHELAFAW